MTQFYDVAENVLNAMKEKATAMGVKGVAVVSYLDDKDSKNWITRMLVVNKTIDPPNPQKNNPGFNLIAVAYSKAGEMMATLQDSGSGSRPLLRGELGYRGGAIKKHKNGYVVAAFSGGKSEQDYEISTHAVNLLCEKLS